MSSPGRNDPCPCGSGKKYKKCCMTKMESTYSFAGDNISSHGQSVNATNLAPASEYLMNAVALHRAGKLDEAEAAYQALLQKHPQDSDALHYLGLIAYQKQAYSEAANYIQAAIHIQSNVPAYFSNLGNVYKGLGQFDAAIAAFLEAVRLDPAFQAAYSNLGNAYKECGQLDQAITSYLKAIELKPDFPEAYNNLGVVLRIQGKLDEAVASFRKATSLLSNYAEAYGNLGGALQAQGKLTEALSSFQQQLRITPENIVAQHHIASLVGNNTERAPAEYVEKVFDAYADKFDLHLVQTLKYDIPEKIVVFVTQHSTPPVEKWRVLDLGCGTGLIGVAFKPYARQLVGVDLSSKMLKKAQQRSLYDRLECLDLLGMMHNESASSYEVIIAADVFVYLGKLDEIVGEVKRLLCPGGIFAFSVEELPTSQTDVASKSNTQPYQLGISGRYAHSSAYIKNLAITHGFQAQEMVGTQIRVEGGNPVQGYMVLWRN
ncbi:MAG: tetratricopeptide repeat protein [Gallionella sp.]|nr:tetratricopeptide repeat protein [Gallionella sp.]